MEENNRKKKTVSMLSAVAIEVSVALVLVAGILATLNYFKIIPVSEIIPGLSFLPKQGGLTANLTKQPAGTGNNNVNTGFPIKTTAIVASNQPLNIVNGGGTSQYETVKDGSILVRQQFRIDLEISADNSKDTSGITFTNTKKFEDKDYKGLHLFRYAPDNNWVLEYRSQGKSTFTVLASGNEAETEFRKFTLLLLADGKTVTVASPDMPSKTIFLPDSFYSTGKTVSSFTSVAPNSKLTIHSLYFQN